MTLHDLAPADAFHVGITCLVLQTIIAVVLFFKHRRQRIRANALRARLDAVSVDNTGLRAQNARLIQTVATLRGDIQLAANMCEKFKPEEEK